MLARGRPIGSPSRRRRWEEEVPAAEADHLVRGALGLVFRRFRPLRRRWNQSLLVASWKLRLIWWMALVMRRRGCLARGPLVSWLLPRLLVRCALETVKSWWVVGVDETVYPAWESVIYNGEQSRRASVVHDTFYGPET